MNWPQITLIIMFALGLGLKMAQHGLPQGDHNFWTTLVATVIQVGILYAGGFFNQA